jgi:ribosomal-protein-alanine N-acetyltransferase
MEIGYWLSEEYWGKGVMSEAARGFTDCVFREKPEIQRVWAGIFEGNVGSEGVMRRAGYTFEATMRKMLYKNGKALDMKVWAMIREDWEKLNGANAANGTNV